MEYRITITHNETGVTLSFPKSSVGKIMRHKGFPVLSIIDSIPELFETSVPVPIEPETKKEGHKPHNNIIGYHNFVNKFQIGENTYYIRFTAYEENRRKRTQERLLHSTAISDITVYQENEKGTSPGRFWGIDPGVKEQAPFIDSKITQILNSVNNASKVVDENGEPLVVYHGSDADFDTFDRTKSRANMDIQGNFFSPWREDAEGYGENVRAFFLNIRTPANESQVYKALNKFKVQNGAAIKAREDLAAQGFDGVNNENEEYIAFEPNQIKDASGNTIRRKWSIVLPLEVSLPFFKYCDIINLTLKVCR